MGGMYLEQSIVIHRTPDEVWKFLGSVDNVAKWDRGVGRSVTTPASDGNPVGVEFDTFIEEGGSDRGKMSYRIADVEPDSCTVQLISNDGNARFFKQASWKFKTQSHPDG